MAQGVKDKVIFIFGARGTVPEAPAPYPMLAADEPSHIHVPRPSRAARDAAKAAAVAESRTQAS